MSRENLATDTANYLAATLATGSLASITWFSTVSELVKVGAGLAAIGMFAITLYKLIKNKK